jgi:hypothetical protein
MPATLLSLIPEPINIAIKQGTDAVIEFQLLRENLTPVDLTAHAVKFTAKDTFGGDVRIATKTNASGGHSVPVDGKTIFTITKTDTTTATPADEVTWVYEVRLVESNGQESVYIDGELRLKPVVGTSA